jgi:ribose 5-phosphate isomerase A
VAGKGVNQSIDKKRRAAEAALPLIQPDDMLGMGTGTTVGVLIELIVQRRLTIRGAISSSEATTATLQRAGIPVVELNEVADVPLYIDGTDELTQHGFLLKGGGGAMTREKILATASQRFVCIAEDDKLVPVLGRGHPVPVEVLPLARSFIARRLAGMGASVSLRRGLSDNGNPILDCTGLDLVDPLAMEQAINNLPGVVGCGLFAMRRPEVMLLGTVDGVRRLPA